MSKTFSSKCCDETITISSFMRSISAYWPSQNWLFYRCPACDRQHHLTIESEVVQFGFLDGAPGPCFIPEYSQRIPGLQYVATSRQARISFGDIQNIVNAR